MTDRYLTWRTKLRHFCNIVVPWRSAYRTEEVLTYHGLSMMEIFADKRTKITRTIREADDVVVDETVTRVQFEAGGGGD